MVGLRADQFLNEPSSVMKDEMMKLASAHGNACVIKKLASAGFFICDIVATLIT